MVKELTAKQARFVEEYLIDLNATQAAIRAGYSQNQASVQGARLYANAKVRREIDKRRAALSDKAQVKAERVIEEIKHAAFFDPADLCFVSSADDIAALPERVRRAIVGWKQTKEGFEIKLADKGRALDQLARHLALYNDKVTVDMDFTERLAARISEAQAKVGKGTTPRTAFLNLRRALSPDKIQA